MVQEARDGQEADAGPADDPELRATNDHLAQISAALYGDRAVLRVVDPKSIVLLKRNARFMAKATFDQLAQNIAADGMLSSVPLCHTLETGELECLSGNHRVEGAIKAGLTRVLVIVIPYQDRDSKISKQLSHNALVGEDDKQILGQLWKELQGIQAKLYSGLDSKLVAELEKAKFTGFTAQQLRTESIALWFLPEEVDSLEELLGEATKVLSADVVYMAPLASYDDLFRLLTKTKTKKNIKNTAVAFAWLIERMKGVLAELEEPSAESFAGEVSAAQAEEVGSSPTPRSDTGCQSAK